MWRFLSRLILKNRIIIILIIAGATTFMVQKGKEARLSYSMAKLLPDDHKVSLDYQNFLEKYGVQNVLVIAIEDSLITNLEHISKWDEVTNNIESIYGVEQVVSFANIHFVLKDTANSQFIVKRWFSENIKSQAELDDAFLKYTKQPFYKGLINSDNNQITTMLITLDDDVVRSASRDQLIFTVKDLVDASFNYFK